MKWSESVVIHRPLADVNRAIADERELLRWSAWPEATGYSCTIDGDGTTVGSAIIFTDRHGIEQGRQSLCLAERNRISYRLRNRGPMGRVMTPSVDYVLEDLDGSSSRVRLDFEAAVPLPSGVRQLVDAVMGRRVRRLHVLDLRQLKSHVEGSPQ